MQFPNLIQKFDAKMQRIIHQQNQTLIDHVQKMVYPLWTTYLTKKETNT